MSTQPAAHSTQHLEIERRFLLDRLPPIPRGAQALRIEQGYLAAAAPGAGAPGYEAGRLRRITAADGAMTCWHSIKTGVGAVRTEIERAISPQEFEQHWPRTIGRRLRKTRYRVSDHGLAWEIDDFEQFRLRLAEVELPSADAPATIPPWLAPHIVREVTDVRCYTNANIATVLGALFR